MREIFCTKWQYIHMKSHAEARRRREGIHSSFEFFAPVRLCVCIVLLACGCNQAVPASGEQDKLVSSAGQAPASLWTRKQGEDWPIFLGKGQDSKSDETGIVTKWSGSGPKLVWQVKLGTSYGAPTIAGGRLMQFD